MPVEHKTEMVGEGEDKKEVFSVSFTNGALEQLRELKKFFNAPDEVSVVKLGVSLMQKYIEDSVRNK